MQLLSLAMHYTVTMIGLYKQDLNVTNKAYIAVCDIEKLWTRQSLPYSSIFKSWVSAPSQRTCIN